MNRKKEFITIYCTYGNIDTVKLTLPSVIEETKRYKDSALIVHDSTEIKDGRNEKWEYLKTLDNDNNNMFLLLTSNMSMAHARNMCLQLGQQLFIPDYISMMEDDHGYKNGFIAKIVKEMKKYYGKKSQNGLLYGMFTGCSKHRREATAKVEQSDNLYVPIKANTSQGVLGGTNSCYRCAPTSHWNNVLKGYDTDEYLISTFETKNLVYRNYNKGFTSMVVGSGNYMFDVDSKGRGCSDPDALKLWDERFTASDPRSKYKGKL